MAIVPGDILVDHGARGGVGRDIVDQAFAHDPDSSSVAKSLAIFGAGSHDVSFPLRRSCQVTINLPAVPPTADD